jgi:ankyrin repeat protein
MGGDDMAKPELSEAVGKGDLETIRSLLDAGADIHYVRPHGYTVMIDVMYGRSIIDDEQLIPVLRLLIEHGADLDAASDYGESALSVASWVGRFDAVGLLLEAGASPAPLGWTSLHRAVALGSVEDVRTRIEAGDDLGARDRGERIPWLLSLQTGDVEKAKMLLAAGSDRDARGRCGKTSLTYPIGNNDFAMLQWLLEQGVAPDQKDDFGGTALIEAARNGSPECARLLLEAGADANYRSETGSAIQAASDTATMRLLIAAGADINDIDDSLRAELTRLPRDGSFDCNLAEYKKAKHRIFGTANPQLMNFPFWKAMVRGGASAYGARVHFEQGRADNDPVWCFTRFGKSLTELPDGRIIEIAGEHEDFYDPDFCIYNDVIVHHGDGTFDIYGYPADVFPPTDFHTATLVRDDIYIVGGLGYMGERHFGTTPVYRLDIATLAIRPFKTLGDLPGWICRHKARLVGNCIEVTGGKVCEWVNGEETYEDNHGNYVLDLGSMTWSKGL